MIANARLITHFAFILMASTNCLGGDNPDFPVSGINNSRLNIVEGVVGRIFDDDGLPVIGALVQPRSLDNPSLAIPEIAIVSGKDGRYTWRLSPGLYELSVSAEGYQDTKKLTAVKHGQTTEADFILRHTP